MLSIGLLATETGVNIETIRYYERIGLLAAPPRTQGRHRAYDPHYVQRLTFIRRSRELGFSLDDIRTLLDLSEGKHDCAARELTLGHRANVRSKIASLRELERALKGMTEACKPGNQDTCPIFNALCWHKPSGHFLSTDFFPFRFRWSSGLQVSE